LRIQYAEKERLFIQGFAIKADNVDYSITVRAGEVKADKTEGGVTERYDSEMTKEKYDIVKALIYSQTATIRCIGKEFYDDMIITSAEKQELKNKLDSYTAAGGKLNFK
jgi:hypothetical protein